MSKRIWFGGSGAIGLPLLALILAATLGTAGAADNSAVKPGTVIQPQNAEIAKDLLSPGGLWLVRKGMTINVVPTERIDWPPPYRDATEKYSQQVRLGPDHRSLLGYVSGQPFPLLDPNDPDIGAKIAWNNAFRPGATDDYDLRFFDCQVEYVKPGKSQNVITYIQVGHYAGYNLVGRTEVQPVPIDPDFKSTNRLWLFALYPVLAPQDAYGTGLIRWRYADPGRGDDSWTWTPGSRRVRRLNEDILSSASGTQTYDPDHYSGFNPKTEFYNYKFIGEKDTLMCMHAKHSPEITCPNDGGATACPENWETRHAYIIKAEPIRSQKAAGGALAKDTVIYLDSEVWFENLIDTYDQKGNLWQTHVYWLTYRDRPVPDARVAIYPFKRSFVVGAVSVDLQGELSTMCYLPGQKTPERECWYINMGAINKDFCTVKAMASAAP